MSDKIFIGKAERYVTIPQYYYEVHTYSICSS